MPIRIYSQKGSCTADNRDVVSHIHSACGTATLFIVLDGATSCASSGEFSRELADFIIAQFQSLPTTELGEKCLLKILRVAQATLQHKYLCDFSSLLLVLKNGAQLLTIHAGDCCLGFIDASHNIEWQTRVHTLANVLMDESIDSIKNDPRRHMLTRSFKAKKYVTPHVQYLTLPSNTSMIMATDGFWALTTAEQSALIANASTQFSPEDDASFILLENE